MLTEAPAGAVAVVSEQERQGRRRVVTLSLALLVLMALSLFLGRYPGPYWTPLSALVEDPLAQRLVLNLRLPRILGAVMVGMVLAASGVSFQMIFRNPLVDSGFLGVSAGASFGASLAIVALGGAPLTIQLTAAVFGILGLVSSYVLGTRIRYGDWVLRLVLSGIAVSALYSSGTSMLKYAADPLRQLPEITFWMLGGLWSLTWADILQIAPVVLPCLLVILLLRWRLNLLSLRDETAYSLGVSAGRERLVLLLAAVLATAAVVSKTGLIGWVGLIVPHIARRWVGSDAQRALPGAMLLGALFTLICDDIARTALTGELPLGILTSMLGAVIFMALMMRDQAGMRR